MTIVHDEAVVTAPAPALPAPTIRRRRVVAALATSVAAAAVAAFGTSQTWAWVALAVTVSLSLAYAALWHRSQRRDMERRFRALVAGQEDFFAQLSDLAVDPEGLPPLTVAARRGNHLVRFALSYAAGWALAPIVFALTVAVGRTPRDTTGQRWLANLQRTQAHLRDGSLRTLAITATATASVTAVGGATLLAGGTGAYAAPSVGSPASASIGSPASASVALPATVSVGSPASASVGSPASASVGLPAAAASTYTVQSGDTLSAIAARYGMTWQSLAADNHLGDPNLIFPGQVLNLGATAGAATTAPAPTAAPSGRTYTVQGGDTLSGIAARYGTTWQALAQINGLANPNFITVGEVLQLAGGAAATTATAAPAPAPPAPATTSAAQVAVDTALAQVGKPYEWAGAGPYAFDCSGLVMYAWEAAGVQLTHYTVSQYEETTRISQGQLQPGDLVFYDTGDGAQPGHVTMYIGNGQIVTADSPGTVIRVENLDWDGVPMGFGRVNQ